MTLKDEIKICYQDNYSCVKTAVETARMALGYRTGSKLEPGPVTNAEIAACIGDLFPRHEIFAYVADEVKGDLAQKNVKYDGACARFDSNPCIWLFSYRGEKTPNIGHMVIGFPVVYDTCTLIAAYKIML